MSTPPDEAKLQQIAQDLANNPEAKRVAAALKIELPEFVQQVMHYLRNPEQGPAVHVVPEEVLKQQGFNPPTEQDVRAFLDKAAKEGEVIGKARGIESTFEGVKPQVVEIPKAAAPSADEETTRELLEAIKKNSVPHKP